MPRIISCSRRTDIAAFYTPWLLNRLRAGSCHVLNPFGGQVYRISLIPEEVIALIFWTRHPAPLIPHLDELDGRGYRYYFNQTITDYPPSFESHNPSLETSLYTFKKLSGRLSPWRVQWRYDPIILSSATPPDFHRRKFEELACALQGYTDHCTFSFVDFYGKTRRNLEQVSRSTGIHFDHPSVDEQRRLAQDLAAIAHTHGMSFNTCCNDALIGEGVGKNRCIAPEMIRRLVPDLDKLPDFRPTRQDCGCLSSADIGAYDTCTFGCAYCYGTNNRAAALRRMAQHDPSDSLLWRPPELEGKDLDHLVTPLKEKL